MWEFSSQKDHLGILTYKMINRKSSFVAFGCPNLSPFIAPWFPWRDLSFPHACHPDGTGSACLPLRKLKGIHPPSHGGLAHDLGSTSWTHWVGSWNPREVLKELAKWAISAGWPTHRTVWLWFLLHPVFWVPLVLVGFNGWMPPAPCGFSESSYPSRKCFWFKIARVGD